MKILWTYAIFSVILGVSAQNVVHNLSGSTVDGQPCSGNAGCTTEYANPIRSCSVGFVLQNNQCVRSEVVIKHGEKILQCPVGYTKQANRLCMKLESGASYQPVNYVCPAGYTLNGNLCYQINQPIQAISPQIHVPVSPTVQTGPNAVPVAQQQLVVQQAQSQCPTGFTFNGGQCAQYTPTCPTGYQYSAGLCHTQSPPCSYPSNLNCGIVQQPTSCCGASVLPPTYPTVYPPVPPIYPPVPPVPPPIPPPYPIPATPQCNPGFTLSGSNCIPVISHLEHAVNAIETCTLGYKMINDKCIKEDVVVTVNSSIIDCPTGYTLTNGGCIKTICFPYNEKQQNCSTTSTTNSTSSSGSGSSGYHHLSNYIYNTNPINVTTNVNANSSSLVTVHLASLETSESRSITNNTNGIKVIYITQPPEIREPPRPPRPNQCCTVVSPRMCSTMQGGSWGCFHRRKQVCSSMCERYQKSVIYLRPPQPIYRPPVMVVPPMRTRSCHGCGYQTQHDCSGCYSRGYCPQYCSSYDCAPGQCDYMNQQSYCEEYGGDFCSSEYGCLEGEYCD